jgi:hypothetical protein
VDARAGCFGGVAKRVDAGGGCSYFVLMCEDGKSGDRWLRLGDVAAHEVIVVHCPAGAASSIRRGICSAGIGWGRICSNSGCAVGIAIGAMVLGSRSLMRGRAATAPSRGWSG